MMSERSEKKTLFGAVRASRDARTLLGRIEAFLERQSRGDPNAAAAAKRVILDDSLGDAEVLTRLKAIYGRRGAAAVVERGDASVAARESSRLRDVERELGLFRTKPGLHYLDVGCGEGRITSAFARALALPRERAYACDITPQPPSEAFVFAQNPPDTLPYLDGSFGLVTMFMSAHHFADVRAVLAEARRVMAPGAWLLIREHDASSASSAVFYDVVHALYECVLGDERTPEEFARGYVFGEYATYRSQAEWVDLVRACGFDAAEKIAPHGPLVGGRYGRDRFDSFYALFVRR